MFYDVYAALCKGIGKSASAVAHELGINKSNVSNWKNNGYTPRGDVLNRIADYFGVSVDYLLKGEATETAPADDSPTKDEELMFALFGSHEEITHEMLEDVKAYARFKLEQKKRGQ